MDSSNANITYLVEIENPCLLCIIGDNQNLLYDQPSAGDFRVESVPDFLSKLGVRLNSDDLSRLTQVVRKVQAPVGSQVIND